jgi:hypothetical protein
MNASSVRPRTKLAAALVAAGVVSAASIVGVADNPSLPVLNIDVANTSVITDALVGLGDAINGVASGVAFSSDASSSLPFDALTAIAVAAQNPSLGPNLLSWLVQRYVNPSDNYLNYSYPKDIKNFSIEPLAALLPFPLGPNATDNGVIINTVNQLADAINNALAGLPSADPGEFATDEFWASDIGRVVTAVNYAVTTPVWIAYSTAYYLGYLPANLEATFESAIQSPGDIPGLVSNLAHQLLSPVPPPSPDGSLFGDLLFYTFRPLTVLPGPIGEQATNFVTAISNNINSLLSQLPTPISPIPVPPADEAEEPTGVQVAGATSLLSTDVVEKKVEAPESPDSTEKTTPATGQDPAPAAGEDEKPAADTDVAGIKPDKPATTTVKSGNKVRPGDKFDNQTKGEKAEDAGAAEDKGSGNGTTVTTPGSDNETAGDPADPTGPQAGETEGADDSDPGGASGTAA